MYVIKKKPQTSEKLQKSILQLKSIWRSLLQKELKVQAKGKEEERIHEKEKKLDMKRDRL